ncbi:MAG: hypothetical protein BWK79_04705 [Beggiatoa sp. IS2]|nr:MAG: hypothetical protein BWK79_04705 [Beggiatoa sp. IS2]
MLIQDENDDFSRLKQRYFKVFSATAEPDHIAVDSRKFAEALCRRLFVQEIGKEPDKPHTLEDYLNSFKGRKLPFGYIYPHLETIQKLGNYAGHDQPGTEPITMSYIQPALSAVDVLMNWYVHTQLQRPNLLFSNGIISENSLTPNIVSESNSYELEMVGGAIPLDSKFYIERSVDKDLQMAIARRDSIVLLKGARQVGKTSLLARGLQQAREIGVQVLLTDFQRLDNTQMIGLENFFIALGELLAEQLDFDISPRDKWNANRSPKMNFDRFFRRELLSKTDKPILWAIDEADRLFLCPFSSDVFSLFRVWHNERATQINTPCSRLTLAIAYATETYFFIQDPAQSPFNVGTKLVLNDFTLEQVADLNQRYGTPLKTQADVQGFFDLVGGHPYLVRAGLNELVTHSLSLAQFRQQVTQDDGVFGDHLRRIVMLLRRDSELAGVVRNLFNHQHPDYEAFYRLRSAGILSGESKEDLRFRCQVYEKYLQKHLA